MVQMCIMGLKLQFQKKFPREATPKVKTQSSIFSSTQTVSDAEMWVWLDEKRNQVWLMLRPRVVVFPASSCLESRILRLGWGGGEWCRAKQQVDPINWDGTVFFWNWAIVRTNTKLPLPHRILYQARQKQYVMLYETIWSRISKFSCYKIRKQRSWLNWKKTFYLIKISLFSDTVFNTMTCFWPKSGRRAFVFEKWKKQEIWKVKKVFQHDTLSTRSRAMRCDSKTKPRQKKKIGVHGLANTQMTFSLKIHFQQSNPGENSIWLKTSF